MESYKNVRADNHNQHLQNNIHFVQLKNLADTNDEMLPDIFTIIKFLEIVRVIPKL